MKSVATISRLSCTGCGFCVSACPVSAISMVRDPEGFSFPAVDESVCIDCGRCLRGCIANPDNQNDGLKPLCSYIARGEEHETWRRSSSGGFAFAAGKVALLNGGRVVACSMDVDGVVRHHVIDSMEKLRASQGSKYVQSETSGVFEECRQLCKSGVSVLFVGTPCQVYAIRKYVEPYSDQLKTIDLICHGVPSPAFWKKDLEYQQSRGKLLNVERILFRKTGSFERTSFVLHDDDSLSYKKCIHNKKDPFYSAFIQSASFRESCYQCKFACLSRVGDITIGDCATADRYLDFDCEHPVSSVFINTARGLRMFNELVSLSLIDASSINLEREAAENAQLSVPSARPMLRSRIYDDLNSLSYEDFAIRYIERYSLSFHIKSLIKSLVSVSIRQKIKKLF